MKKYTIDQLNAEGLRHALEYAAEMCDEEEVNWENQDSLFDYAAQMGFWFDENGDRVC